METALLEEEVDDARARLEALARDVDNEHIAVEDVGKVCLIAGVGAEGVFELRIGEPRKSGFNRAVDGAAFLVGVLRGDGRFETDRALEPPRIETPRPDRRRQRAPGARRARPRGCVSTEVCNSMYA